MCVCVCVCVCLGVSERLLKSNVFWRSCVALPDYL